MALIDFKMTPTRARWFMNVYPPYLGAGIRCREVSSDFRKIVIEMPLTFFNRNFVGSHFGGSLYSMCDPWFMFMMLQNLGQDYIVWDQAAAIKFVKPGRGSVRAVFVISQADIDEAREKSEGGDAFRPTFNLDVTNFEGGLVATVEKQLYIRRKR